MKISLKKLIQNEIKRQEETLDLIPSENVASKELLSILGSPLTNKYSEGYPGRRYYPGNEIYDIIELLAQKNALKVYRLSGKEWAVNVQSYSGSPANQAIYLALLKPGDAIMGLALAHGGHLTHGHAANFSGTLFRSYQYGLNPKTERIDYIGLERIAKKHNPKIIVSGATAYPREIDFKRIGAIAKKVGAYHIADVSHIAGLITAGLHQSPFPYADVVMTTTHKTLRGPRGAVIFSKKQKEISEKIDKTVFPGLQGGPHNNVIAGIAYTFEAAKTSSFKRYQRQIVKNAKILARELNEYGFRLISGGTDNHLLLIDMRSKKISGREVEQRLESVGILANRNSIPTDTKPMNPSGIRLGTPAVTTRGMKEKEMKQIAGFIHRLIDKKESQRKITREVKKLCRKFRISY